MSISSGLSIFDIAAKRKRKLSQISPDLSITIKAPAQCCIFFMSLLLDVSGVVLWHGNV